MTRKQMHPITDGVVELLGLVMGKSNGQDADHILHHVIVSITTQLDRLEERNRRGDAVVNSGSRIRRR